ncbi:MAG TPA: PDZ domain-containing protein [Nocardioidaceae bacterium]|nr:PDZ domain-containing protein [Nocardioidaceae bacterium]
MTRRKNALALAITVLAILVVVAFLVPLPYVVLAPGLTANALGDFAGKPVVTVAGHPTYRTTGHLNLTTVSVTRDDYNVRLGQLLAAWWSPNDLLLPREVIYPPNETSSQVVRQNRSEMLGAQSAAVVAGLGEAGIHAITVRVDKVSKGFPAYGVFRKGDRILAVDGKAVHSATQVADVVEPLAPGTAITVTVVRSGRRMHLSLHTTKSTLHAGQSMIGITMSESFKPPFKVRFNPAIVAEIGGPSAGLMFALAVYDKITPGALTGGRFVAGTGTITADGQVGPIGGVQQKIAGAYAKGARYFLVPAGDCAEAAKAPDAGKVRLITVHDIGDAVRALRQLDRGDEAAISWCGAASASAGSAAGGSASGGSG